MGELPFFVFRPEVLPWHLRSNPEPVRVRHSYALLMIHTFASKVIPAAMGWARMPSL